MCRFITKKALNILPSDELEIIVIKSLEEIEAIRQIWEQMQRNEPYPVPNSNIDIYLSAVRSGGEDVRPYIILVRQNENPLTMLIGRIEKYSLKIGLGYKTLFSPRLKCLSVVYGGILGQQKSDVYSLIIDEMSRMMSSREVDMIFFNHLKVDSDIYRVVTTKPGLLRSGRLPETEQHWGISLPDTMDQLYERYSPKNRSNLRRLTNRLERAYPGQIRVMTYTKQDEVQKAIDAMAVISAQTYQIQLDGGFVDNSYTRDMLKLAAKQGWLRACVLFVGEEPSAYELALRYGKSYFGLYTGFDPKWKQFRVGTVLFLNFLESVCGDPKASFFDFGFGDAEYKRLYSDRCWDESSVYIFAQRLYPIFVNALRNSTMCVNESLGYIVSKVGAKGWIKRKWRNSMVNETSKNET
jgi:hypothetical protein